ncbi:hypothetical protein HAX54_039251 [Datura stramonium]|uniref:CCHC-type domain-containing protein n=1 Tax=Datura stramonium TaxID=4076 RepID=A0ABS8VP93_DATST|nr:hypothetical protein [Datura stramonium]
MANREEEEAIFQGDNQGIEPQRKSKSSRRDKSRGRDPSAAPVAAEMDQGEKDRGKSASNQVRDGKGDRNRSSHFRKDYEERKKGVNNRDQCYLCGDPSHVFRNCPKLGKLAAMTAAEEQPAHTCPPATAETSGQQEQGGCAARGKDKLTVCVLMMCCCISVHLWAEKLEENTIFTSKGKKSSLLQYYIYK